MTLLVSVTSNATGRVRRNFAGRHLAAVAHFSEELRLHEAKHAGEELGDHFALCGHYGTAAIILSCTAIEAGIDEAKADLKVPDALSIVLDKASMLDHAQALLAHYEAEQFDKGAKPYQSVHLLRALRNGLVHPKAEYDDTKVIGKNLSSRLLAAKLPLSPFWPDPGTAFPHGCMSAGVAQWAYQSAREFMKQLRERLGLDPKGYT